MSADAAQFDIVEPALAALAQPRFPQLCRFEGQWYVEHGSGQYRPSQTHHLPSRPAKRLTEPIRTATEGNDERDERCNAGAAGMDWVNPFAGLIVGFVVGMTGVGGGSLMAPIMILMLGVAPATAVGTDLWFAAITKTVGGTIHHKQGGENGGPDFEVIRRLCYGSLPAALVMLWALSHSETHQLKSGLIMQVLGVALILTAMATVARSQFQRIGIKAITDAGSTFRRYQPALTVLAGAILGALVTLTSVGAGALGVTMLLALYPLRMNPRRLVATDIIHAVPLTLVAGLGHLWIGNVNPILLGGLLLGSIPGIIAGSLLAARVSERILRPALALILLFAGTRLLVS